MFNWELYPNDPNWGYISYVLRHNVDKKLFVASIDIHEDVDVEIAAYITPLGQRDPKTDHWEDMELFKTIEDAKVWVENRLRDSFAANQFAKNQEVKTYKFHLNKCYNCIGRDCGKKL